MKLVSLNLNNYRKYVNETIDFPDGLIGIVGPNGAGKTTILEAVAWALYGHTAARTTKEEIKRHGAGNNDLCEVVLEIEQDGIASQIVRQMKGTSFASDAAVYTNKKLMARGIQATTDYVTNLLGLDREAFFTSFFAKQKELNALSDLRPAERKSLIIRMLGIDDVDKAIQQIRQDVRDIDIRTDLLKNTLKDLTSLQSALVVKENKVKELGDNLNSKKEEESRLEQKRNQAKTRFRKEEKRKDIYQQLVQNYSVAKSQYSNAQKNLENWQKELRSLDKMEPVAAQLTKESEVLEEAKQECQKLARLREKKLLAAEKMLQKQNLIKKLQEEKADQKRLKKQVALQAEIDTKLKQGDSQVEAEKEREERSQLQAQKAQAELASLEEQHKKLKAQSKEVQKLGPESKCPTCLRPLGDDFVAIYAHLSRELSSHAEIIKEKAEKLKKLQVEAREVKNAKHKLEEEREQLRKEQSKSMISRNELTLREKSTRQTEEEIKQVNEQLKEIQFDNYNEDEHFKLEKKVDQLTKRRDQLLKIQANLERRSGIEKNISATKQEIENLAKNLAAVEKKGRKLAFSQEEFEGRAKAFEETEQKHNDLRFTLKDLQHDLHLSNLEIDRTEKEIAEDKEKQAKIKESSAKRQYLDKTQIILNDFRKHLIGRIRPLLAQKAGVFLSQATEGKYTTMELNEDYEILIYDEGEKFLIERFSGGEKDLANLCLRLSISQLITESRGSRFGFIILDEVFGSQDTERKANILKALSKLNNQFRQIFLITHVDDIKDQVEYVLSIKEDEGGTSHAYLE